VALVVCALALGWLLLPSPSIVDPPPSPSDASGAQQLAVPAYINPAAGAASWGAMLEPYVPGRWVYRSLSVNYRTPAEIMAVAARLLAEFAPGVQPPESVRSCGVQPWSRQVSEDELPAAIKEFVHDEAGREGTSIVIGPPGVPGTVPPAETKGLEFDSVLVVDPQRILASGPRGAAELYVALTRATQRLGVLHRDPLPQALSGLENGLAEYSR